MFHREWRAFPFNLDRIELGGIRVVDFWDSINPTVWSWRLTLTTHAGTWVQDEDLGLLRVSLLRQE